MITIVAAPTPSLPEAFTSPGLQKQKYIGLFAVDFNNTYDTDDIAGAGESTTAARIFVKIPETPKDALRAINYLLILTPPCSEKAR